MILGACGLQCSECEAYKATQADDSKWIDSVVEDWNKQFGGGITAEGVWCDGCMTDSARKCGHCGECEIRACAVERELSNCAGCSDYLCEKLSSFIEMVPGTKERLDALRANG